MITTLFWLILACLFISFWLIVRFAINSHADVSVPALPSTDAIDERISKLLEERDRQRAAIDLALVGQHVRDFVRAEMCQVFFEAAKHKGDLRKSNANDLPENSILFDPKRKSDSQKLTNIAKNE